MNRAQRLRGGYGTGEGRVGLVENDDSGLPPAKCGMCGEGAVLYFVDSAEEIQHFACMTHAAAVAYDVAVASTADPNIPASERGPDDRRWRDNE
ncbi:hypothetical protein [Streptodolium elevatio]|uniref:Uncharacterized protein n=1 Tax=Streptodolium elevatio TaxID=3157996 RepID=A0ABV3DC43_9ACTN